MSRGGGCVAAVGMVLAQGPFVRSTRAVGKGGDSQAESTPARDGEGGKGMNTHADAGARRSSPRCGFGSGQSRGLNRGEGGGGGGIARCPTSQHLRGCLRAHRSAWGARARRWIRIQHGRATRGGGARAAPVSPHPRALPAVRLDMAPTPLGMAGTLLGMAVAAAGGRALWWCPPRVGRSGSAVRLNAVQQRHVMRHVTQRWRVGAGPCYAVPDQEQEPPPRRGTGTQPSCAAVRGHP